MIGAFFCVALIGLFPVFSWPQSSESIPSQPFTPDVFVNVKEYSGGAEMVSITALKDGYPGAFLQEQCMKIALNAGSEARGLQIQAQDLGAEQGITVARASFGTDNLIDRSTGALNIQAIARAFAGFDSPYEVDSIVLTFEGEQPGMQTLKSLDNEAASVSSQELKDPSGIEYQIKLKTQIADEIVIPSLVLEKQENLSKTDNKATMNPMVFILLGIGALAAGALVYFAALRSGSKR